MRERLPAIGLAVVCVFGATARAEAQLTTSCLRPFAIVDKWIENQTPPFDGFDTFDPSGPNPDVYLPEYGGFKPLEDDGRLIVLTGQAGAGQTLSAGAYVPLRLDESNGGATAYRNNILGCVGLTHSMGELLPIEGGILTGVTVHAIDGLIAMDPAARWDGDAKQIVGSAFAQSPRVIHLPVIDPAEYVQAQQTGVSAIHIKNIVGFFVDSMQSDGAIRGYLTARATLSTLPSIVPPGRMFAMVGAQLETPGGILSGVPIELEFLGETAGVALTDEWNEPVRTSVAIGTLAPGRYVAAIRARLATGYFLRADESTADFIVQQVPQITWPAPSPIAYGTPLGPSQLNAAAPIPGQFTYWPPSGTILHAGQRTLSITFMPLDREQYVDVVITAVGINVLPAPLTVSIIPASKVYLDPMPAFALVAEGFANGDTLTSLSGSAVFQTSATASSPVGAYAVYASGLSSPDYAVQYQPGTLNVLSRVATLLYPANGATGIDLTKPFTWTSVPGVQAYYLYVGTSAGGKDLVNTGEIQQTSYSVPQTVPGGTIVYARLWTKVGGTWGYVDSTFSAAPIATPIVARLSYPASGATIVDPAQPFTWNAIAHVQAYYLYVGSTPGAKDLVNTGETLQTSYVLRTALPNNQTLCARLWTKVAGVWRFTDSTFSVTPLVATLTYPTNGATNIDVTLPLRWTTIADAQVYYLYVGSTPGAKDLVNTGEIQQTSYLVRTALPANQTLYARLWTKAGGIWRYRDSTFSAAPAAH